MQGCLDKKSPSMLSNGVSTTSCFPNSCSIGTNPEHQNQSSLDNDFSKTTKYPSTLFQNHKDVLIKTEKKFKTSFPNNYKGAGNSTSKEDTEVRNTSRFQDAPPPPLFYRFVDPKDATNHQGKY